MINTRKSYTIRLYNGTINKQLLVNYGYTFIPRTYEEKYPTVKITDKGNVVINHSYSSIQKTNHKVQIEIEKMYVKSLFTCIFFFIYCFCKMHVVIFL